MRVKTQFAKIILLLMSINLRKLWHFYLDDFSYR